MKQLAIVFQKTVRFHPCLKSFSDTLNLSRNPSTFCRLLSSSSSPNSTNSSTASVRSKFSEIPVNPSILKHIEKLGVGRPRKTSRRRKTSRQKSNFLSEEEEINEYRHVRRASSSSPPPPFAANSDNRTDSNASIRRFPVKLLGSVGSSGEEFPRSTQGLPEVAIAGRSNVGKSTLLNALLYGENKNPDEEQVVTFGRKPAKRTSKTAKLPKGLKAATSAKPGETRRLSFYQLSSKVDQKRISLLLVDLPGYGFAYASEGQAKQWQSLMESYILDGRKSLKRILLLIDSRHGMKKADIDFLESLQRTLIEKTGGKSREKPELPPIQVVLTKCDLVDQADLARRVILARQQLSACLLREPSALPIMLVSAQIQGQAGVLELQKEIAGLASESSVR